ncbi:MAG: hypothetical protein PHD00_10465 [Bacteroidales bacterium]|nr:hypothetical protein [Bacteroidales bacterium]MDD4671409.1 hypothetical protein [Bacteroidales bacterium]
MKKIITILFLSAVALSLQAQITGGQVNTEKPKPSNNVFKKYTNVHLHFSKPLGQFGDIIKNATPGYDPMNVGLGIGVTIGQGFYFNNLNISQKSRLGMEVTYLDIVYQLPKTYSTASVDISSLAGTISAGLGLTYSYNPKDNLIMGVKFNLLPTVFDFERTYTYAYSNNDEDEYIGWAAMLRSSAGVFVRNNPFYVGFDISFGTKKDMTIKNSYATPSEYSFLAKTTRLDIVVGFSF